MNIELPSLSAFALESSGTASLRIGGGHTLTLRLGLTPVHPAFDAMSGSVSVDVPCLGGAPEIRAAVVPADGPVLTLTF